MYTYLLYKYNDGKEVKYDVQHGINTVQVIFFVKNLHIQNKSITFALANQEICTGLVAQLVRATDS